MRPLMAEIRDHRKVKPLARASRMETAISRPSPHLSSSPRHLLHRSRPRRRLRRNRHRRREPRSARLQHDNIRGQASRRPRGGGLNATCGGAS